MKLYGSSVRPGIDLLAYILRHEFAITSMPEIAVTDLGKPYFKLYPQLHFNYSHSKSLLLCAVSSSPVGVDIEDIRPRRSTLPAYALSPEEFRKYELQGGDWPSFYSLWTQKEAWCKYTGQGLRNHWNQPPETDGVYYGRYQGDGWCAAVCGEECPPETIIWLEEGVFP